MSKAKRATLTAQLDNNLKDMQIFQSGFIELESKLRASQLETRLALLENKYKESERLHQAIVGMDDTEEYLKAETWTTILKIYMELKPDLKDAYEKLIKTTPDLNVSVVQTQQDFAPPRLNVPPFDGTYESWPTFKNTLDAYFLQYSSMSNIQKLNVLKTKVVGDAAILIQHLNLEESGYKSAMSILTDRYENKRVLVNAQLRTLLNQPQITHESAIAIKTMLDTTNAAYHSLKNLNVLVEGWNSILIFLLIQKLPYRTQQLWEEKIGNTKTIPEFTTFKEFLENRFRALESVQRNQPNYNKQREVKQQFAKSLHMTSSNGVRCAMCKDSHSIRKCKKFEQLTPVKRLEFVKTKVLCWNCLGEGHKVPQCTSKNKCRECQRSHHILLHITRGTANTQSFDTSNTSRVQSNNCMLNPESPEYQPEQSQQQQDRDATQNLASCMVSKGTTQQVLLATALVQVTAPSGREIVLKALLDQGSQASFITEKIAQRLQLPRKKVTVNIQGVGNTQTQQTNSRVSFIVRNLQNTSQLNVQGFVLKKITDITLGAKTQWQNWSHIQGINLADPKFYESSSIDLLLGADVFAEIILNEVIKGGPGRPLAQNSIFGWILSGEILQEAQGVTLTSCHLTLDNQLKKFWELEEILDGTKVYTEEERQCEQLYKDTILRLPTGKYKVFLPLYNQSSTKHLGASKHIAIRRLHQLEARFNRDARFKAEYSKVINEYLQLGHMVAIKKEEQLSMPNSSKDRYSTCYLPHHGVIKESSSTTKLRVVFDASQPTESGNSLNDILLNGPVIQDELVRLFIRWRKHKIAFTADIEKMYRQIWVDETQADYQRILWRENSKEPIKEYKLLTVTFGTKSAPYLAIKTLQQLALDEAKRYPIASKVTLSDFYVDDLLSGAEDVETALHIQREMIDLMNSGGFPLRKWMSNAEGLRVTIQDMGQEKLLPSISENTDEVRALGIRWNPMLDTCYYAVNCTTLQSNCSKRTILSQIAKLFDP